MANLNAVSVAHPTVTHAEFEFDRQALTAFVASLQQELQQDPGHTLFHLQIQRRGQAPGVGATAPINQNDPVTITIHRF